MEPNVSLARTKNCWAERKERESTMYNGIISRRAAYREVGSMGLEFRLGRIKACKDRRGSVGEFFPPSISGRIWIQPAVITAWINANRTRERNDGGLNRDFA